MAPGRRPSSQPPPRRHARRDRHTEGHRHRRRVYRPAVGSAHGRSSKPPRSLARTVVRRRGQEAGHSSPVFPLSRYGPAGSSTTGGNADRAALSGRTQPTGKAKPALRVEPRPWEGCGVNGPAKFPLFDPGCLAVRARQARSRPHSKKGRSCSPWLT